MRPIAIECTRALRRDVLRPYMSVEELATHEPPGAVAFGAFDGDELVAVGAIQQLRPGMDVEPEVHPMPTPGAPSGPPVNGNPPAPKKKQ